jgi:DNA polymerase III gamma/tau subunit
MEPWTSPVFSQGELRMTKNHRSSVAMPLAHALIAACGGAASSPPPDRSAAREEPSTTAFKAPPTTVESSSPAPSPPPPEPKAEEPVPKPTSNASDALWAAAKREQQESIDAAVVRLDAEITKLERTHEPWGDAEIAAMSALKPELEKYQELDGTRARTAALVARWNKLRPAGARAVARAEKRDEQRALEEKKQAHPRCVQCCLSKYRNATAAHCDAACDAHYWQYLQWGGGWVCRQGD